MQPARHGARTASIKTMPGDGTRNSDIKAFAPSSDGMSDGSGPDGALSIRKNKIRKMTYCVAIRDRGDALPHDAMSHAH